MIDRADARSIGNRSIGNRSSASARLRALAPTLMLLALFLAPLLFPGDPRAPTGAPFLAPSWSHPLGTDDLGRDLLAALAHGGRASMLSGGLVVIGAAMLALAASVTAGIAGGWSDRLIVRLMDASQIVPRFFLALLTAAWLGPGWWSLAGILIVTGWAPLARQLRAEARALRSTAFIEAALLLGAHPLSVAWRHLLPNLLPLALPQLPLIFANALLIEAGLSFLGAGDPSRLSWGLLVHNGQAHALRAWWLAVFPGLALALATAALMFAALAWSSRRQALE